MSGVRARYRSTGVDFPGMRLSLGGCFPFEQPLAGDESAHECADNRVQRKHRLVRKIDEIEQGDEAQLARTPESTWPTLPFRLAEEGTAKAEDHCTIVGEMSRARE